MRRTRDEFEYQLKQNYDHNYPTSRKRAPKQMWVAKGDMNQHDSQGNFIRATRLKTDSVFDRISENERSVFDRISKANDGSADPARAQGRLEQ